MKVPEGHFARTGSDPRSAAEPGATNPDDAAKRYPQETTEVTALAMCKVALAHAEAGYYVHRLKPGGKVPLASGWQAESTRDPNLIRVLWAKSPDANVGINTGRSGVLAADLDTHHGKDGVREWAEVDPRTTPASLTPSGGQHVLYRASESTGDRVGLLPGVDIRSGGNLVAPGSIVNGRRYTTPDGSFTLPRVESLPIAPSALVSLLHVKQNVERTSEPLGATGANAALLREVDALLNAPPGGRNDQLARSAFNLGQIVAAGGLDEATVRGLLASAALKVGLSPEETFKTIEGQIVASREHPRPMASDDDEFERRVRAGIERREVDREVARRLRLKDRPENGQYEIGLLGDLLQREPDPEPRIAGLMPWASSVLVSAAAKTGKTTLALNLAWSLITGRVFLGAYPVRPVSGRVALLNFEVSGSQIDRWADERGVPRDRLVMVNLRGRINPFNDEDERRRLAADLQRFEVESLIVDPFGRAFSGDQNANSEVAAWLVALDFFARTEAGVTDLILTTHAGWNGDRTRGASALEDWPDAIWRLTKDEAGGRFFSATGRDVDLPEDRLTWDASSRVVEVTGEGGRRQQERTEQHTAQVLEVAHRVLAALRAEPGQSVRQIQASLGGRKATVAEAIELLKDRGDVRVEQNGQAKRHYLTTAQEGLPDA